MRRRLISALLFVPVALAQPVVSARAGLVSYIEGPVSVDGQPISVTLDHVVQMKDGQVLQTERGLAEMFLSPGTVLRLGNSASVKFQTTKLADTQLSIETGTALVEVLTQTEGNRLQIRSGLSLTEVTRPGLYRFDAESKGLRVYGGEAAVHLGSKTVKVKRDRSVALTEGLAISKFNRKEMDSLHQWAALRSFTLFDTDDTRWAQKHWLPTSSGTVWNDNYSMEFLSPEIALMVRLQHNEAVQHDNARQQGVNSPAEANSPLDNQAVRDQQQLDRSQRSIYPAQTVTPTPTPAPQPPKK